MQTVVSANHENFKAEGNSSLLGFHRVVAAMVLNSPAFDQLTEWEQDFIQNIAANEYDALREKQWSVLGRLVCFASNVERRRAGQ